MFDPMELPLVCVDALLRYLSPADLFCCRLVSKRWYSEVTRRTGTRRRMEDGTRWADLWAGSGEARREVPAVRLRRHRNSHVGGGATLAEQDGGAEPRVIFDQNYVNYLDLEAGEVLTVAQVNNHQILEAFHLSDSLYLFMRKCRPPGVDPVDRVLIRLPRAVLPHHGELRYRPFDGGCFIRSVLRVQRFGDKLAVLTYGLYDDFEGAGGGGGDDGSLSQRQYREEADKRFPGVSGVHRRMLDKMAEEGATLGAAYRSELCPDFFFAEELLDVEVRCRLSQRNLLRDWKRRFKEDSSARVIPMSHRILKLHVIDVPSGVVERKLGLDVSHQLCLAADSFMRGCRYSGLDRWSITLTPWWLAMNRGAEEAGTIMSVAFRDEGRGGGGEKVVARFDLKAKRMEDVRLLSWREILVAHYVYQEEGVGVAAASEVLCPRTGQVFTRRVTRLLPAGDAAAAAAAAAGRRRRRRIDCAVVDVKSGGRCVVAVTSVPEGGGGGQDGWLKVALLSPDDKGAAGRLEVRVPGSAGRTVLISDARCDFDGERLVVEARVTEGGASSSSSSSSVLGRWTLFASLPSLTLLGWKERGRGSVPRLRFCAKGLGYVCGGGKDANDSTLTVYRC